MITTDCIALSKWTTQLNLGNYTTSNSRYPSHLYFWEDQLRYNLTRHHAIEFLSSIKYSEWSFRNRMILTYKKVENFTNFAFSRFTEYLWKFCLLSTFLFLSLSNKSSKHIANCILFWHLAELCSFKYFLKHGNSKTVNDRIYERIS